MSETQPQRARRLTAAHGFTLIEVMVIVAIVGVVAVLAAPSITGLYRRMGHGATGRQLYSALLSAQSLATGSGQRHCVLLVRGSTHWDIRRDSDSNGICSATDQLIKTYPAGSDQLPNGIDLGPPGGTSAAFPAPYDGIEHNSWCTPTSSCLVNATTGSILFDVDGRIVDTNEEPIDGAIVLYDSTGKLGGAVKAVVFRGATGNIRLFDATE